jgi:outer membrane PBP1 activator LpoA protein
MQLLMTDAKSTSALRTAATRTLLILLFAVAASCTPQTQTTRPATAGQVQDLESRARAAVQTGNWSTAADLFAQLAASASGTTRSGYLIESARASVKRGDPQSARRRLGEARSGASLDQQKSITVLLASLEVADRRPQPALDLLATVQQPLPASVQRDAAAVRGQALFQLGRHADAVRAFVEREVWLEDSASILENQRMIWEGFKSYPPPASIAPTGDRIVDGWLALAPLASSGTTDLRRSLLPWRTTYTDHPAAGVLLADLLSAQRAAAGAPSQIALLLPLSSPQRSFALAIRDGFLAAHLRGSRAGDTTLRIYDTSQEGSQNAYLRAQLEGADFIVGPLLRPDVEQVITQAGFVPTLALNFSQAETPLLQSFYQFSLSPDDEARVIADSIAATGASTAIAFVPSSDRGYRTLASFRAQFEARGGRLLDFVGFDPRAQDFSQQITTVLNVARSNQRERRLSANLGIPIQFEPRRRQDIDAIFITADDTRMGRLLLPQLRFYFAGDIPTYATSDVYDPANKGRADDLNGVIFTDSPAVITPDAAAADLQRDLDAYWPRRSALMRYYAMGFDAYQLVGVLYNGERAVWPLRGASGDLSVDEVGRIHRALPLAQFQDGRPAAYRLTSGGASQRELVGTR